MTIWLLFFMGGMGQLMTIGGGGSMPPVETFYILTEVGNPLITESGDNLVTEP